MKNITEKDLFKFVFSPTKLSADKHKIITENPDVFNEDLRDLNAIKMSVDEELGKSILERIHEKIEILENEVTLNLVKSGQKNNNVVLAADSLQNSSLESIYTFIDEANRYLGKVIIKNNKNKIYLFSKSLIKGMDFVVKLFPSKDVYYVHSEDMPLIISPEQKIDKIVIKFA